MTPRSLDAVRRDDELLDRLGAREIDRRDVAGDDPVVRLLAALAQDVDRDLPGDVGSVDSLAVEALAAAVSRRSRDAEAVAGAPSVSLVRELPRRRRVVAVRRGGAVVAGFALVVASAGVAAAVTGDPAGAFGVRAVSSIIDHVAHRRTADPAAVELERRVKDAERQPGVDPSVVATLEEQASRLPDQGGAEVQAALARLRLRLLSATGSAGATGGPGSGAAHGGGQPSGHGSASAPGHERPSHPERTTPAHTPPAHTPPSPTTSARATHPPAPESHGKASGRPTTHGGGGAASGGSASARSKDARPGASPTRSAQDAGQGAGQGNGAGGGQGGRG
ncbi:MAG TPA: hypothetical protein VHO27_15730 [Angustibacter sp.]|nr:hypothetical protein [Angustibacter sp.]